MNKTVNAISPFNDICYMQIFISLYTSPYERLLAVSNITLWEMLRKQHLLLMGYLSTAGV